MLFRSPQAQPERLAARLLRGLEWAAAAADQPELVRRQAERRLWQARQRGVQEAPLRVVPPPGVVPGHRGAQRADVNGDPNLPNSEKTLNRWFNTAVFTQPAQFRFGNQGVNIVRGDGVINLDSSILRNFPLTETIKFQFRGEFFNITNHPNFGNPGATLKIGRAHV